MIRCNRCGALFLTHHLTLGQKKKLVKKHDQECPKLIREKVGGHGD